MESGEIELPQRDETNKLYGAIDLLVTNRMVPYVSINASSTFIEQDTDKVGDQHYYIGTTQDTCTMKGASVGRATFFGGERYQFGE